MGPTIAHQCQYISVPMTRFETRLLAELNQDAIVSEAARLQEIALYKYAEPYLPHFLSQAVLLSLSTSLPIFPSSYISVFSTWHS